MDDRMIEQFVDEDDFIINLDFDNQLGLRVNFAVLILFSSITTRNLSYLGNTHFHFM